MASLSRYFLLVQRLRQVNRELMADENCTKHYEGCRDIYHEAQRMGWRDNARTPPDEVQSVLPRDVIKPNTSGDRIDPHTYANERPGDDEQAIVESVDMRSTWK
jgi:hypothetical protein